MKSYLNKLPKEIQGLIHLIGERVSLNNVGAYLVGGFVRDLILGVKNLDLDIVIEGNGIKFAEGLAAQLKAKLIRHMRFGTATITLPHSQKIDIATARCESYPQPACLPQVTIGTLEDDLKRRDFSINAMAINLNGRDYGNLIDLFGGKSDLHNKKIRILHELSFIDDPTRILRAIRFEKRYNFKIENKTLRCLMGALRLGMLEKVQPHRLRDELILTLKEEQPLEQIRRIDKLIGFSFVNPRLRISKKTYNLLRCAEREIAWFKKIHLKRRQLDTWLIYFMALVDSLNIDEIKDVCKKFAFTRGEEKRILSYKKIRRSSVLALSNKEINPAEIYAFFEPLSYETILLLKARYNNRKFHKHADDFFEIYNGMRIYVSGDDLHGLGLTPGPFYQRVFTRVLNAKLNGLVKTKDDELMLIRKLISAR